MSFLKRMAAGVLAVILAVSLAGCNIKAKPEIVAQSEHYDVTAGIYIALMVDAISIADDATDVNGKNVDKWDGEIYGQSYDEWVTEQTKRSVLLYLGIMEYYDSQGLTLTDQDRTSIEDAADYAMGDYYRYYYTDYYTSGVTTSSYRHIAERDVKKNTLFNAIYGASGTQPVYNEEIDEFWDEHVAKFQYLAFVKNSTYSEERLAELKEEAQGYVDRINNGESFDDVYADYAETTEAVSKDDVRYFYETEYNLVPALKDALFNQCTPGGDAVLVESNRWFYVVYRHDHLSDDMKESARNTNLQRMKRSEFEDYILDWVDQNLTVTWNDNMLDKYQAEPVDNYTFKDKYYIQG